MATKVCVDVRRTDVRSNVRLNPYWMTSGALTIAGDDLYTVLFSFPDLADWYIHDMIFEVKTGFTAGTITIDIGSGTLATDNVTTGGVCTTVDDDEYMVNTEITGATPGWYPGNGIAIDASGAVTGSDWAAAKFEGTQALMVIQGADTTVPVIYAYLTSDGVLTAGEGYLHVLISRLDRQH